MYNSIPNIDNTNNVFKFQYKGKDYEITIPHGAYEISSLNNFIKKEINSKFEFDNLLEIKANSNTLRCVIELNDNELERKYTEWPNPQITEFRACDRQSGLNDSAPRNHILVA